MACTCNDVGLDEIFTERFARRDAEHYRKRGLPRRARLLLQLIEQTTTVQDSRTLEGGAGSGALTVELARRGAVQATAIDATPIAIQYAEQLAASFQVQDRTHFRAADFASTSFAAEPADIVILDRVVCCYPDWRALLGNAIKHADRVVALTYPAPRLLSRFMARGMNGFQALLRRRFRMQLHPPELMLETLRAAGFTEVTRKTFWFWELAVARK